MRDLIRVNTNYSNLQHPTVQPPTPTMVPWLPKQLKEKFECKDRQICNPKKLFITHCEILFAQVNTC